MGGSEEVLIPAKFISIILHLIVASCLLANYRETLYASNLSETSSDWDNGKSNVVGAMVTTIIFCSIEIIILFFGINMHCHKLNFIQSITHASGIFFYTYFSLDNWRYNEIWSPWFFFSLCPMLVELFNVFRSLSYYNKFKN